MIITDETFDQVISENKKVLVDFWAEWCGPCKRMNPILEEVSSETGVLVGKLNVDENSVKPFEFSVQTIPTMVLFVDGVVVKTLNGAMPKHQVLKEISEWI
ncbi:MAG: thioredoxin [Candidatus Nanopelagicaceae bacterium]